MLDGSSKRVSPFRTQLSIVFLFLVVIAIYFRVVGHTFVWDTNHIFMHEQLKSFTFDNLVWVFTHPIIANWHPLTWLSHMLDYSIFGSNSGGHHFVNVLFHGLNSVLVFLIVKNLAERKQVQSAFWIALLSALVFAVHPQRVESVAWVAARKDLLYSLFYLAAIAAYLGYCGQRKSPFFYVASVLLFSMSLMSKSMAVTLPAVLMILDFYLLSDRTVWMRVTGVFREHFKDKIPFFILSLIFAGVTLRTQSGAMAIEEYTQLQQITNGLHNSLFYLEKFFVPLNLSPYYPFPEKALFDSVSYWLPGLVVTLLATGGTLVAAQRGWVLPIVCWGAYLVILAPAIGVIHVGSAAAADRYAYLSLLPMTILLVASLVALAHRLPKVRSVVVAGLCFWLLGLSALTNAQVNVWQSPFSLWTRVLQIYPGTLLAHRNISTAYYLIGEHQLALKHLQSIEQAGWQVDRELVDVHSQLGNHETAINYLKRVVPSSEEESKAITLMLVELESCVLARDDCESPPAAW